MGQGDRSGSRRAGGALPTGFPGGLPDVVGPGHRAVRTGHLRADHATVESGRGLIGAGVRSASPPCSISIPPMAVQLLEGKTGNFMSNLIAIIYPDVDTAIRVR